MHPGILGPLQVFEITPGKDGELKVHEIDDTLAVSYTHLDG